MILALKMCGQADKADTTTWKLFENTIKSLSKRDNQALIDYKVRDFLSSQIYMKLKIKAWDI